ncbi:MAG: LacI family transcriptional regulator [Spirochaetaceae bacterium]|nr:MAG: LacI family transcriptional regulator [Spirochaetaceae bacterium]
MATIKQVAEAAGVSTATVSRVLSNTGYAREETRKKVFKVVAELGYRPNNVARNLRVRRTNVIALVVADIENPYFSAVGKAVQDLAYLYGMQVILCNTDEDLDKEQQYLDVLKSDNAAGIIIAPTHQSTESFRYLADLKLPTVVIDRSFRNIDIVLNMDNVVIDNRGAGDALGSHLLERKRNRIGGIFGYGSVTGRERFEGVMEAHERAGVRPTDELFRFVAAKEQLGYQACLDLIERPDPPDALIASNGLLAAGAYRALKERKVDIPNQLAFASFDDTLWTPMVSPAVTVIRQPTSAIGRVAVELLLKRIQDPELEGSETVLKSELVVRDST